MNDRMSDVLRWLEQVRGQGGTRSLPPRTVLRLQQTLGNREVARLLAPPPPQASAIVEIEASPSPGAALRTLTPLAAPPRLSPKARLAVVWARLTGSTADED